jgi:hypothetical protein
MAVRIAGVDPATVRDAVTGIFLSAYPDPRQTPIRIAGKDVIAVTNGPDRPDALRLIVYASGDVAWLVGAVEPTLTEILEKLP